MAAATIPETVTVPGQVAYDALVALSAARNGLEALESPLAGVFHRALFDLYESAFGGPYHVDDELTIAPLALAADEDANRLLRDHVSLGDEP
jgi:hypothetical protein